MSEEIKPIETEDLTTSENKETEVEGVFEWTTREEYINCSYTALAAMSEWDPMNKPDKQKKINITAMCYEIITSMVEEMYEEVFPTEDETE